MTYLALIGSILATLLGVFVKVKASGESGAEWALENQGWLKYMPFGAYYVSNALNPPAEEGK